MNDKFWIVWADMGGSPTVKHLTPESAKREAERLARENSGRVFHVMEVVASCKRNDVLWKDYNNDSEIPF